MGVCTVSAPKDNLVRGGCTRFHKTAQLLVEEHSLQAESSGRLGLGAHFTANLKYRIWKSNLSCALAGAPQQKQDFLKTYTEQAKEWHFGLVALEQQKFSFSILSLFQQNPSGK